MTAVSSLRRRSSRSINSAITTRASGMLFWLGQGSPLGNQRQGWWTMKFTGSFKAPRINVSAYRQKLQEVLGDAIAHAAFEWLGATVQEVPVWSGASRATFMPLA